MILGTINSRSLSRLGLINSTAIAVACVVLASLTGFLNYQSVRSEEWIAHTRQIETTVVRLFSILQDAETGQRGYLLTGDEAYLEPHERALENLGSVQSQLGRMTLENPEQQDLIRTLQALIEAKVSELRATIILYRQGRADEALALVKSDLGKNVMDDIRMLIAELLAMDKGLMATHRTSREQFRHMAWVAFALTILGVTAYSLLLFRRISKHIAAREEMEGQLREAVLEAEGANRAKSDFLAAMSHELRTPLNAICGFSQMIEEQSMGPISNRTYVEYARDIHWSGQHLLSVINDVLDLAKIEAGKLSLSPTRFELAPALSDVSKLIEGRGKRKAETIQVEIDEELSDIYADPRSFRQILLNLLSNADKFSLPDKLIQVRAGFGRERREVAIAVSDEGLGIAPEDLETVLQPFGQVRESAAVAHEGTGLGLPIVKHLVEMHGGKLRLTSALNKGTTVEITFPLPGLA